ncbi:SNF1-like_9 [Blepharisma stoltei]|uniref:Protein kinase domain-containing protein n=1 Tax=Blepharisma stoltei TaxID=1481888 RepID=A0AAU9JU00_9CILI|nr:unnamed protein product [Blepharisma stoltei]
MSHLQNYTILKSLGKGTFGKVKLASHKLTGIKVAFKILHQKDTKPEKSRLMRELTIHQKLRHFNIIRLYEVIETVDKIYMVMEYVPNGDFQMFLNKNGKLDEEKARFYFQQLISAVKFCHKKKVAHRDLKLENLMLDENMNIKISDFGLSNFMEDGKFLQTYCGSLNYSAPEILLGTPYNGASVDIWSCGVILYTFLTGMLPFSGSDVRSLFKKIVNGRFDIKPVKYSKPALDLIYKMLDPDPISRINIEQIEEHPWIKQNLPMSLNVLKPKNSYFDSHNKISSYEDIDSEIFETLMKFPEFSNLKIPFELVKNRILNHEKSTFTIAYELLLEAKIKKGSKSLIQDKVLRNNMNLNKNVNNRDKSKANENNKENVFIANRKNLLHNREKRIICKKLSYFFRNLQRIFIYIASSIWKLCTETCEEQVCSLHKKVDTL